MSIVLRSWKRSTQGAESVATSNLPVVPRLRGARISTTAALTTLVVLLLAYKAAGIESAFPAALTIDIATPVDRFADWVSASFRFLLKPLSDGIKKTLRDFDHFVLALPWLVSLAIIALIAAATAGWRLGVLAIAVLVAAGLLGLWDATLKTLNIMALSVAITVALGIPAGIWAAGSDRVDSCMRPVLDAMQTMPTFVYLIPVMLLFGIGSTSAVIATVVYAAPPVIRLTNLGLRQVPVETIEAARSFGSTSWQELFKVRLPLARPSIMMGINQTIMMALGMVIFVALIGAEGLGKEIWSAMRRLKIGAALEAGLVVVLIAILLDRFGYALARRMEAGHKRTASPSGRPVVGPAAMALIALQRLRDASVAAVASLVVVASSAVVGRSRAAQFGAHLEHHPVVLLGIPLIAVLLLVDTLVLDVGGFPRGLRIDVTRPVDEAVRWMNINLAMLTDPAREAIYIYGLGPTKAVLSWLPWPVIVAATCLVAWKAGRWAVTAVTMAGFAFIGVSGMWLDTLVTVSQVMVALVMSLLLAVPLGIMASKSDRFDTVLRPVLDTMQTLPAFVYFPLVVMLFKVGDLAGIIATVIYAMPPAVRLTNLGIRQVAPAVCEAARSFGSTPRQTLGKVELPLALPSIMMGINQTTILALAMVVYAALIGAKGLGAEVLVSIGRFDVGGGFVSGMSIVLLAVILDRITQGFARSYRRKAGQKN